MAAIAATPLVTAGDWPMWRHDAARSARTAEELPAKLRLRWVRELSPPVPAYRSRRLQFDRGYEPIAHANRLFVASSRNDRVTALDAETGEELWRFYTDGPVRFAPVASGGKVYVGADDGRLHCLDAVDGRPRWTFRAAPSRRKVLGNGRLISLWPVRGGPVIDDEGRIYFAAGVWPFEGTFVYALDAASGDVLWVNDRTGFIYGQHPHDAEAFGGVTPQGYLAIDGDELIVPCGTAYPARFDRRSGALREFRLPKPGRFPGGWFAAVDERLSRDARRGRVVFDSDVNQERHEDRLKKGEGTAGVRSTVFAAARKLSFGDEFDGVSGEIHSLLIAERKLFVVTLDAPTASSSARIYCLGEPTSVGKPRRHRLATHPLGETPNEWTARVRQILRSTAIGEGYALVWGVGSGRLVEELLVRSDARVIAVDPDVEKIEALRRRLDAAGVYGTRAAAHVGRPLDFELPLFMAQLIVSEDLEAAGLDSGRAFVEGIFRSLRPYGGVACLGLPPENEAEFDAWVKSANLENARLDRSGSWTRLVRNGALPGSSNYTGGWVSRDELVRAPLGVLWFDDAVSVFKRSPQPQIVDGVLISRSKDWLSGKKVPYDLEPPVFSDVYTGRTLSASEAKRVRKGLPKPKPKSKDTAEPQQYRPPYQKNAWKPDPPRAGLRVNPLTGIEEPRTFPKSYGCDGGIDYGHVYTMRSGTPAFYDKRIESGTVNISGPRSGCTNSIIPANGVLNVPYFYAGCTCSYPLPVSLAMVSMPASYEQWTAWGAGKRGKGKAAPIERLGINLGAPGDRITDAGTLWLDVPSVGGPSPGVAVQVSPDSAASFYRHSLWIEGGRGWPWVAASGLGGVSAVTIEGLKDATYTVRLYFCEPDRAVIAGRRVFDVAVQGDEILRGFDVAREAGGPRRSVVKELRGVRVPEKLEITFSPRVGEPLLCGVELIADGLKAGEVPVLEERKLELLEK